MKRLLLLACLSISFLTYSQEEKNEDINVKHEIRLNMASAIVDFPELSYEYILNEYSGFGLSAAAGVDDDVSYRFMFYPYYRLYFGKKYAAGFFMEMNGAFYQEQFEDETIDDHDLGLGIGLGLGSKFLTRGNWVGEFVIGAGKNFINTDNIYESYGRFGISFAKRF